MVKEINLKNTKKSQEEFVGFALILIIGAVILLVFLAFSLTGEQKEPVESYEVESFLEAILYTTTECQDKYGYLTVKALIVDCYNQRECLNGKESCEVLNSDLNGLLKAGWDVNAIKGYYLNISSQGSEIASVSEGNKTNNYKGVPRSFSENYDFDIIFTAYY